MQVTGPLELYKPGIWLSYIVLTFLFFIPDKIFLAQQYPDEGIHLALKEGIKNIIDQDYHNAELIFARLKKNNSGLPLGDIYLAAVKISKSVDYGQPYDNAAINDHFNRAEKICKALLKKNKEDKWNNYFYALLTGYSAYFQAIQRNYVSAFSDGLTSKNHFEKCLASDSLFIEAYLALGTYKYWKSEKADWIPFVSDERETGIKYLEKSIRNPSYNYHLGINSLIWIYLNDDQVDKAIAIAEKVLTAHPNSRLFKRTLAYAYQRKDKSKSIVLFKDILNSVMQLPTNNHYNEIVLKHKIAMLYAETGQEQNALEYCNEILRISNLTPFTLERLGNRMERVRKLQKELSRS